jgi:NADPH-dependent curcumin reductase CurA
MVDPLINRRIVLARRPQGLPTAADFRLEEARVPQPADGELLLRTLYLSLDPYMRQLMDEVPPAYASSSVQVGEPMPGGTVSRVVESRHPQYKAGDLVLAQAGWQEHALSNGEGLMPIPPTARPSLALGGLGMTAFTAYVGLLDIGQPKPGETVVVAAATGAVGAMVGQIARLKGARVVGIAGGADKCRFAMETLRFDACLDRHDPQLARHLAEACPQGIDVYFENVGGPVFDAVLPLLNIGARMPVVGNIAHYNDTAPPAGPDRLPQLVTAVLQKRLRLQGLVILDHYASRFDAFRRDMEAWVADGRIRLTEDVVDGLQNAPAAFIGMLQGRNLGKVVVRVSAEG